MAWAFCPHRTRWQHPSASFLTITVAWLEAIGVGTKQENKWTAKFLIGEKFVLTTLTSLDWLLVYACANPHIHNIPVFIQFGRISKVVNQPSFVRLAGVPAGSGTVTVILRTSSGPESTDTGHELYLFPIEVDIGKLSS
jgi:hypothetical protein